MFCFGSIAILLVVSLNTLITTASILLVNTDINDRDIYRYDGLPALFGKNFFKSVRYPAILGLPTDPYLCELDQTNKDMTSRNDNVSNTLSWGPSNLPTALLVRRGLCTFERKGLVASQLPGVKYLIVYGDPTDNALVPMAASETNSVEVGMMFVSYKDGLGEDLFVNF